MRIDKSVISTLNKSNVLNIIRNNSPIFKAEISRLSNLSIPTVMKITEELMSKNLIIETGKGVSSGGKPPQMLEFNSKAYQIVGVDINEYRIDTVLMNLDATIVEHQTRDIGGRDTGRAVTNGINESVSRVMESAVGSGGTVLGIGIGVAGIVDSKNGVVAYSPTFNWKDLDLLSLVQKNFSLPVMLDNDTRAMAMGEKLIGIGRDSENFVYIDFGVGIGSAMVIDGKLYYGSNQASGMLGHMAVEKDGPVCQCGNIGCLDLYASPKMIGERARDRIRNLSHGETSQVLDLVYGDIDKIDVYTVLEAAENGDKLAIEMVKEATGYLGLAVTNLMNIVDPELIVLNGKIVRGSNVFYRYFRKEVERRQTRLIGRQVDMKFSSMGKHIGAIGAGSFILNAFIESGGEPVQPSLKIG